MNPPSLPPGPPRPVSNVNKGVDTFLQPAYPHQSFSPIPPRYPPYHQYGQTRPLMPVSIPPQSLPVSQYKPPPPVCPPAYSSIKLQVPASSMPRPAAPAMRRPSPHTQTVQKMSPPVLNAPKIPTTCYKVRISQGSVPPEHFEFFPCLSVKKPEILSVSDLLRSPLIRFDDELKRVTEILLEEERVMSREISVANSQTEPVEEQVNNNDKTIPQEEIISEKESQEKSVPVAMNPDGVAQEDTQIETIQDPSTQSSKEETAPKDDQQKGTSRESLQTDCPQEMTMDTPPLVSPDRGTPTPSSPKQLSTNVSSAPSTLSSTSYTIDPSSYEDQPSQDTELTQTTDSSLFEKEESSPRPQPIAPSLKIDEEVLATAQDIGYHTGPTGLPLFNLDRLQKQKESDVDKSDSTVYDDEEMDEDDDSYEPPVAVSHKQPDNSILVSQLSQMEELSSVTTSDDEESQHIQALREGEAEVRNTATSSLLSLMQMNKAVTKTVKDSEKQQQILTNPQHPQSIVTRSDSLTQDQYRNPREFLTNYVCHLSVWEPYHFQNSRGITLCSTYSS